MLSYESNIKKIIEVLLYNSQYLTLDYVAQSINRSKRSVQNYLADIDNWILKNGLLHTKIVRKQGKGITIDANAVDKLKIERLLSGNSLSIYNDDNRRRLDIIKKLIILEEEITIRSLCEQFFVSRSTILSDLSWVREWLSAYGIGLITPHPGMCTDPGACPDTGLTKARQPQGRTPQRKGIAASGGEVSYRNAIAGYFDSFMDVESGDAMTRPDRGRIHDTNLGNIIQIYPEETVLKVKEIIEASEEEFGYYLTDDYYASLLTHLVISVSRLINGNTVPPEFAPPGDEEFPAFILETAGYITKRLESVFQISVSVDEKIYICIHLVGFNAVSAEQEANAEIPMKIKYLALELIKAVDARMGTRFISDELLFLGLCLHLKSKVFRLQKNIYYKKAFRFQLSEANISIYNAVIKASPLYQEVCGVDPDEEELLNVTCYLLLSMHRNLRKPKALLVCSDGVIERMEFMDSIMKAVPSIEVADCCTACQLKLLPSGDYDFIISAEAFEYPQKPVIDLSSAEKNEYAAIIMGAINKPL